MPTNSSIQCREEIPPMVHTAPAYERPLEELSATEVPIIRTEIPGPRSRGIRAKEEAHASPGLSALATLSSLAMEEGKGALVRDADGNVYIDFSSGTVVSVTGHSHPS